MVEEVDKDPTRAKLLESLADANKRLVDVEAAKKRDNKLHGEDIKSIREEMAEYLAQLKQVGDD